MGADIDPTNILEAMNRGKILEESYIFTVSPGGLLATHPNASLHLTPYTGTWLSSRKGEIDKILSSGGELSITAFSDVTNTTMQLYGRGEMIGDTGRYWLVCGVVPVQNITASSHMTDAIGKQARVLTTIAQGDYSVEIPVRSDKDVMNQAINSMLEATNSTLARINAASHQLSVGAKQIADGSQALASGATEQAATVEELSDGVRAKAGEGTAQMNQMISAVREISESSLSIGRVIKVIDDIAFQTNILALNAAVEAGKGFAVVAEEVRNLAAKSAEAAKDTGSLIETSISKAETGVEIAGKTAESLNEIVAGVNETTDLVESISAASESQYSAITQINTGISQVTQVVQQNSATAEESAAASEEMSGQADLLAGLVAQFKLKRGAEEEGFASPAHPNSPEAHPGTSLSGDYGKYGGF